jgi:copper/silver efflux system protein
MIETVIIYKSEYLVDQSGRRLRFRFNPDKLDYFRAEDGSPVLAPDGKPYLVQGKFARNEEGRLIPDPDGMPFRLWRPSLDPEINEGRDAWPGIRSPMRSGMKSSLPEKSRALPPLPGFSLLQPES